MVTFFLVLLFSIWSYKLVKIIRNSKDLSGFVKELENLSKKNKFLDEQKSERYMLESNRYRLANKKITKSKLLWFSIEVMSIVVLYFVFIHEHFS
ncbi:hypothetical protein SAMN06265377_0402 [Flagellimonas pacifica]|uniref:Uncharacterized protein n=1 Tax=Flagellimonas pacifica TaxID=1247520 RepID=A0A285MC41_9FLAO|nr:hypothetical protein SAMN06265377_0402 [Allomuricauda parva]